MKKICRMAVCLGLIILVCSSLSLANTKTVLKFAHHYPLGHPHTLAAEYFKKAIETRSHGDIEVQLYPNNQMGNSQQIFEGLMMGSLDIILTDPGAPAFAKLPLWDMVMGPFMYRDYNHAYKVAHSSFMKKMYADCEKKIGVTVISPIWFYGVRQLTTAKTPVRTPDDLKGLKIRTPDIPGFIKAIEVIGGTPTPISFADLYLALKQNVVDGQENPVGIIYANKYYEAQKYLILTGHIISKNTVYMNTKSLKKLSKQNQSLIRKVAEEAGLYNDKLIAENEKEMIGKLKEMGMEVITPDTKAFQKKAMEGLKNWFNKDQLKFYNQIQAVK